MFLVCLIYSQVRSPATHIYPYLIVWRTTPTLACQQSQQQSTGLYGASYRPFLRGYFPFDWLGLGVRLSPNYGAAYGTWTHNICFLNTQWILCAQEGRDVTVTPMLHKNEQSRHNLAHFTLNFHPKPRHDSYMSGRCENTFIGWASRARTCDIMVNGHALLPTEL